MKAIIFILGLLFITNGNAQQKFDCTSKTKDYQELLKAGKISESFDGWDEVKKNCPKEETVYTDGIQILQYKTETAKPEEKEKQARELMKLYDQYNKYFPKSVPDFEVKKAIVLIDNRIEAKDEIFSLLDNGFTKASESVTDVKAIYTYFTEYCQRFSAGDKKITANSVLEKYTSLSTLLTRLKSANPNNKGYKATQNAIDKQIKDIATCDSLAEFYTKNFEANKDNSDWIISALVSLSGKCGSKPIFLTLAEKVYSMKVTEQSASFMALASVKQRKFPEAIKYYNESAELQTNPSEKAKTYYTLATGLLAGDFSQSKDYLNKAIAADPKMGKAYLYLAQLYVNGSKDCGQSDFEKKAVFNLAIQTAQKAVVAEERLQPTAGKLIENFRPKALSPSEISKAKMNGKSVTIGCWINETITFPAQ